MNNIKRNKFIDTSGLILHKKTEAGTDNTFLVKPHKSGDLNSYAFEEINKKNVAYKSNTINVTDTITINVIEEEKHQRPLVNKKPKLVSTNTKKQDTKPTIKIKAVTRQTNTNTNNAIKLNENLARTQKTVVAKQVNSIFPKVTPHNLVQKMATSKQPIISPGNINILKRGLLIGINYTGSSNHLDECINNCENIKNFLVTGKYFKSSELVMMTDYTPGALYPSRKNIMNQLDQLVKFARNNPKKQIMLFVSYSGHGNYISKDTKTKDKILFPIDFDKSGYIADDDLRTKFINQLPSNVKLLIAFDACHNPNILGLKYAYKADDNNTYTVIGKLLPTVCDVIMISSCADSKAENSNNDYEGAISASLLANYKDANSYNELIINMRKWLKEHNYTQIPQLTSGKLIDTENKFLLSTYK